MVTASTAATEPKTTQQACCMVWTQHASWHASFTYTARMQLCLSTEQAARISPPLVSLLWQVRLIMTDRQMQSASIRQLMCMQAGAWSPAGGGNAQTSFPCEALLAQSQLLLACALLHDASLHPGSILHGALQLLIMSWEILYAMQSQCSMHVHCTRLKNHSILFCL